MSPITPGQGAGFRTNFAGAAEAEKSGPQKSKFARKTSAARTD